MSETLIVFLASLVALLAFAVVSMLRDVLTSGTRELGATARDAIDASPISISGELDRVSRIVAASHGAPMEDDK